MNNAEHKELSNICFSDQNFLNSTPLTKNNAMQYFMLSDFFDKTSINQFCIDHGIDFVKQRTSMNGIEYILESVNKENDLFIIAKYSRKGFQAMLLGYYYIFNGTIYQSPNLFNVVSSKIQSISNNFINFIDYLNNPNEN